MAGNGGKRPGAGRKPGVPNKASAEREAKVRATGETPLDYMLRLMRDDSRPLELRCDMAKAAAPYVHPKLAAVEHTGKDGDPLIPTAEMTPTELARSVAFLMTQGVQAKPTEH
jgi:hypothetical protein